MGRWVQNIASGMAERIVSWKLYFAATLAKGGDGLCFFGRSNPMPLKRDIYLTIPGSAFLEGVQQLG